MQTQTQNIDAKAGMPLPKQIQQIFPTIAH